MLGFILLGLGHTLALFEVGGSIFLNLVFVSIGLLFNLGSQLVLLDFNLFLRENLLTFGLFDFSLDGLNVDSFLLFLLLDGVGSIGISLSRICLTFQGSPFQSQVVVLDGNGCVGIDSGIVGIFVGMGYLNLHVTLCICAVDAGVFLDFCRVVGTEVVDKSLFISDVLDVA